MKQRVIEDWLSQHADQLVAGSEAAEIASPVEIATTSASSDLSAEEQGVLSGLMLLARRAQAALVEVEPRPAFISDLKARLLAQRRAEAAPVGGARRGRLWVAGLVGALTMASLGFLGYRAARAGREWMSAAAAARNARPALPKA